MISEDIIVSRDSVQAIASVLKDLLDDGQAFQFKLTFVTEDGKRRLRITPHCQPVTIEL